MSIFGDETITLPGSPEESGQDEGAAEEVENEEAFEEQDEHGGDEAEFEDESDEEDQAEGDEDDAPPEDGQGDGLILGKFKTQGDLVKAYQNLERAYTQQRQGGGQQPSQDAPSASQQPGQNQRAELTNIFWERFKSDPLAAMEAVVSHMVDNRTAPIFEKDRTNALSSNLQTIAKEYRQAGTEEGLRQLLGKVQEIAEDVGNPDLIRNPSERVLRMAAREAFGDTAAKAFAKGKEAGRTESERTRASKANAAVRAGGKGGKQTEEPKTPEQTMKEAILAAGQGGGGIFG